MHYGRSTALTEQRSVTLDTAFIAHPARFKGVAPRPPSVPTAAWINPPKKDITTADHHTQLLFKLVNKCVSNPLTCSGLIRKLGKPEQLRVCYEAGPTGYVLYWQLTELGVNCEVVAPTLMPVKAGDRVKTDRRDAEKLARCYRAGDLTAVWVPDAAHEALRDLVRARLAAKRDQLRARHRLGKFLLRQGRRAPEGRTAWTGQVLAWVKQLRFEQPAQEVTLMDYLHEVEHAAERIVRLERSIDTAVETVPQNLRAVIEGLQACAGSRRSGR